MAPRMAGTMPRIRLIHWHADEAKVHAEQLRLAGYDVACDLPEAPVLLRQLRSDPPSAVIIDLSRVPSRGRDVAVALRTYKDTRAIPLVLVGGDPDKLARVRELLPDAVYATWEEMPERLAWALANPPAHPVVPESAMAGYSGAPLVKKLGIRTGSRVALVGAPPGFADTLGDLPPGAHLADAAEQDADLILWFVRTRQELEEMAQEVAGRIRRNALWIAWPKKAASLATDLTQQAVREAGLAAGLVDYKICSIDETWSALLFRRRKG